MKNTLNPSKQTSTHPPVRVGISIGDINGIGPEVIMKSLYDNRLFADCTPIVYGNTKVFSHYKKILGMDNFNYQTVPNAEAAKSRKVNVINVWNNDVTFEPGKATKEGGEYALKSLDAATKDLASGKIDVLVTAPISKEAMGKAGFRFPGHTEYLADMAGEEEALMLMISPKLRVGLVTTHIPIKNVSETITIDKITEKIQAFNASLRKDFGILRPKIAVFGLNPHAGENGKMGQEEQEVIIPAINRVKNNGILAFGPFPADGFFGSSNRNDYDGILAMYHDQGLAAFKALAFDDGVNFTAGLPIVRTSPDHGTAFDIVGKGIASGNAMLQAIYLAMDVHRTHVFEKEITKHPLKSQSRLSKEK